MLFPIIKEMGGTKALCPEAPKALHGISQRPALLLLKPEHPPGAGHHFVPCGRWLSSLQAVLLEQQCPSRQAKAAAWVLDALASRTNSCGF